jgi:S1-C subfamily serine protease
MYSNGEGVSKNERIAVFWYTKAAEKHISEAQFNLALMYSKGQGVPKDDSAAVFWYAKAAEQGNIDAQLNLGLMYSKGRGVPKDDQAAYFWWLLSSAQGNDDARHNLGIVERKLIPQQRADAQAAARVWKPVSAATAAPTQAPPQTAPSSTGPDSTGTGFRIARDHFVTNHHVIEDCRQVRVDGAAAQVGASDARMDLALLSASVTGPIASVRVNRPLVGEAVTVAGFPLQGLLSGFQVTTGTLASLSGLGGDTSQFQITAPVQAGNSGGPVLDSAGRVMGVVVAKLNAIRTARVTGDLPQNVNFAVGGNALRSFLDATDVNYQTSLQDRPLQTTAVAQQAQGFTVRVECWK